MSRKLRSSLSLLLVAGLVVLTGLEVDPVPGIVR